MQPFQRIVVPLVLALCAGCVSTWLPARFVPSPLEVAVRAPGEPYGEARALLAVRGIRRAQGGAQPAEVEVNLRLENVGQDPFRLAEQGFDLVTSDLVSFRAPRVEPPAGELLGTGEKRNYRLCFATPEGTSVDDFDWSGLNVSFKLLFGEREVLTGVTFDRLYAPVLPPGAYCDPYWGPYPYGPYADYSGARVGVSVSN